MSGGGNDDVSASFRRVDEELRELVEDLRKTKADLITIESNIAATTDEAMLRILAEEKLELIKHRNMLQNIQLISLETKMRNPQTPILTLPDRNDDINQVISSVGSMALYQKNTAQESASIQRLHQVTSTLSTIEPPGIAAQGAIPAAANLVAQKLTSSQIVQQLQDEYAARSQAMVDSFKANVHALIGSDAATLSFDKLKSLIDTQWKGIFGRTIGVDASVLAFLDAPDLNGIIDGFIDIKITDQSHVFKPLFDFAIRSVPPTGANLAAEKEHQSYVMGFIDAIVRTMSELVKFSVPDQIAARGSTKMIETICQSQGPQVSRAQSSTTGTRVLSNKPSDTDLFKRKPDFTICGREKRITFVCEINKNSAQAESTSQVSETPQTTSTEQPAQTANAAHEAEKQLLTMAVPFDKTSTLSNAAHQSFGAIFVGNKYNLFFFEQIEGKLKKTPLQSNKYCQFNNYYSLDTVLGRLQFATNMVTIFYIISLLDARCKLPDDSFVPTTLRRTCALQYTQTHVLKMANLDALENEFGLTERKSILTEFYKLIGSKPCPIEHSLLCDKFTLNDDHNTILVALKPVCTPISGNKKQVDELETRWPKFIQDVLKFLRSIHAHGFVHGDLRLDNVVCYETLKRNELTGTTEKTVEYLVIDYENVQRICDCGPDETKGECVANKKCTKPLDDLVGLAGILFKYKYKGLTFEDALDEVANIYYPKPTPAVTPTHVAESAPAATHAMETRSRAQPRQLSI